VLKAGHQVCRFLLCALVRDAWRSTGAVLTLKLGTRPALRMALVRLQVLLGRLPRFLNDEQ
jgi:hypothetical protein